MLSDLLVYPITICSMFEFLLGMLRTQQNDIDIKDMVLFAVQVLQSVVIIYGTRCIVILKTTCTLHQAGSTAQCFHLHFFLHMVGQMLTQVLMIVCIGAKMFYENRNFSVDNTVHVSLFLWYMIAGGLVLPFVGVFTFAIGKYYSVQLYPIGFFLDLYTAGIGKIPDFSNKIAKIAAKIEADFDEIYDEGILYKYGYVFMSPVLVTLSIIYALLLYGFAACYFWVEYDPEDGSAGSAVFEFVVPYFGSPLGWILFLNVAFLLVIVANILVLFVAAVWIIIILIVWTFIEIIVVIVILVFLSYMCRVVYKVICCKPDPLKCT